MKKVFKVFAIIFSCAVLLTSLTACSMIYDLIPESILDAVHRYEYSDATPYLTFTLLSDDTYEVEAKDHKNMPAKIIIPDSYDGKTVTSIGEDAFSNCTSLTSVNYTGTINQWAQIEFVDIDANPVYYAKKLYINNELVTEAVLTTATKISNYAFCGYSSLTSVVIGDGVTSIGSYAFYSCDSLTVYYKGTAEEWDNISINSTGNSYLFNATRYFYSETKPADTTYKYWHYDASGNPVAW